MQTILLDALANQFTDYTVNDVYTNWDLERVRISFRRYRTSINTAWALVRFLSR